MEKDCAGLNMKILNRAFTLLHIRTYKMKFMKFCLRKWIFVIFFVFALLNGFKIFYAVNYIEAIISACFAVCFLYLSFYWVIVWKKANYLISSAIHTPFPDPDEKKGGG